MPLVETLANGTWTATTPDPPNPGDSAVLSWISCTSATHCRAAGLHWTGLYPQVFLDSLAGTTWTPTLTPALPDRVVVDMTSFVCPSADLCRVLGTLPDYSQSAVFTLSSGAWTTTTFPEVPPDALDGSSRVEMAALACDDATSCVAVGFEDSSMAGPDPLAEEFSGGAWTPVPVSGADPTSGLGNVSCWQTGGCIAVGSFGSDHGRIGIFAEIEREGVWTRSELPLPPENSSTVGTLDIRDVSCAAANFCVVTGESSSSSDYGGAFADTWSGSSWTVQRLPDPVDQLDCPAPGECVAIGYSVWTRPSRVTGIETLHAGTWTRSELDLPPGGHELTLRGISCADRTHCVAVGDYVDADEQFSSVAATLAGGEWVLTPIPYSGRLGDVSCPQVASCVAIGDYFAGVYDIVNFTEVLSGGTWTTEFLPDFGDNRGGGGAKISCPEPTACVAVSGYLGWDYRNYATAYTLDDGVWTHTVLPAPDGASAESDADVACIDAAHCTAVGSVQIGPAALPLILDFS